MSKASRRRSPGSRDERRATIAAKKPSACFHGVALANPCAECARMLLGDGKRLVLDAGDVIEP